ncbi:interferon beta-like [Dromiciops gliroides]|uniref:interferon beta-like n=1 Tax=Dromiciops gliroides TaxID=33562 RepID=UPI001CC7BD35|nr:interferon beta-like [Dromiciops gliroides]
MANRGILQLAILLLLSAGVSSKDYVWLRSHQRRTNQRSLTLLTEMIGKIPLECDKDRMDFQIPWEIIQPKQCQKENATVVIHEMLQQIFLIFNSKNAMPGVNKTIIKTFLNGIYQQMVRLEMAFEEEMEQTLGSRESILQLKKYYQEIRNYLKNKEYSPCAWKVVHVETRKNFIFLSKLTKFLKN